MSPLIFGIVVILLIFFSGWIAIIGPFARYIYFGLGFVFGFMKFNSTYHWVLMVIALILSFWVFRISERRIQEGNAVSYIPRTITLCQSAFFFGLILGLVTSFFRWF
jgi:hypothetical protein